jgi:hypothetical protein
MNISKFQELETHAPASSQPAEEHARLGDFAGRWQLEGHNFDGDRPGPTVSGEASFEWLPGNFFLFGREETRFANQVHVTLMVFSYQADTQDYRAHFFDNYGFSRVYAGEVEGRSWRFSGRLERVRIEVSTDGRTLRHSWERTEDGSSWVPLCDLTSRRV